MNKYKILEDTRELMIKYSGVDVYENVGKRENRVVAKSVFYHTIKKYYPYTFTDKEITEKLKRHLSTVQIYNKHINSGYGFFNDCFKSFEDLFLLNGLNIKKNIYNDDVKIQFLVDQINKINDAKK